MGTRGLHATLHRMCRHCARPPAPLLRQAAIDSTHPNCPQATRCFPWAAGGCLRVRRLRCGPASPRRAAALLGHCCTLPLCRMPFHMHMPSGLVPAQLTRQCMDSVHCKPSDPLILSRSLRGCPRILVCSAPTSTRRAMPASPCTWMAAMRVSWLEPGSGYRLAYV